MNRRVFMKSGAMALATMGLDPSFLRRTVFAQDLLKGAALHGNSKGKVLIVLFQRGAADALNVVVPFGEKTYYKMRPTIAVPRPVSGAANTAIDLDGFFGLHPSLASFKPLWDDGILAPVHAVGSPSNTRSHFDAQDYMESGTPDNKGTRGRLAQPLPRGEGHVRRMPRRRSHGGVPRGVDDAADAAHSRRRDADDRDEQSRRVHRALHRLAGGDASRRCTRPGSADVVHAAGGEMFEAMKILKSANPQQYQPQNSADYPRSPFGQHLRQIAQLIKADVGLEIAFADVGGWDTHVNQGGATGQLAQRLDDFSTSIAALVKDLGPRMADVTMLTMSEFGRTAHQNGNGGTDHGHATAMFVIGGDVKGHKVHGKWPGLEQEQLNEGRDLALTTDFRSVFSEVAFKHLGAAKMDAVFPGFSGDQKNWLGVL